MSDYQSDKDFFEEMKSIRKTQNISLAVGIVVVLAMVGTIIWGAVTLIQWLVAS